jgi:hypothetical protein
MSARAVPCEVPAIKRNIVSGRKEPAGSSTRTNREDLREARSWITSGWDDSGVTM